MKGLFSILLICLGFSAFAMQSHDPPLETENVFIVEMQSELHSEVVVIEAVTHEVATELTPIFAYEFSLVTTQPFLLSEEIDYTQADWLIINTGNVNNLSMYTQRFYPVGFVWCS